MRMELTELQKSFVGFGPLQSMSFKGVTPDGVDIYEVTFKSTPFESSTFVSGLDSRVDFAWSSP